MASLSRSTPDHPAAAPTAPSAVDTTRREPTGTKRAPDEMVEGAPGAQPKLPHERDESVDMTHGHGDAQVAQAYRDVKRGLPDTDRGPPADRAYQQQKQ